MHKDTIVEVSLCDTFLYPVCAHDISTNDLDGMPNFENDTLGESESGRNPCPWLLLPFDPDTILGYGTDSRSNLFQEGEDDMGTTTKVDWSCPVCPLSSKSSHKQMRALAVSVGYLIYDLVCCLFDKQVKIDNLIHHLVSAIGLGAGLAYEWCGSEMVAAL
ncbi:putative peroxidase 9 [Capsicum annuum]|nr:putative peroxidase 9 [Capsicum annuum]